MCWRSITDPTTPSAPWSASTNSRRSWLDVAEIELSGFTKQCLARRIDNIDTLRREAKAWADARNAAQSGVDWQFINEQARIKLKHLYPQVMLK